MTGSLSPLTVEAAPEKCDTRHWSNGGGVRVCSLWGPGPTCAVTSLPVSLVTSLGLSLCKQWSQSRVSASSPLWLSSRQESAVSSWQGPLWAMGTGQDTAGVIAFPLHFSLIGWGHRLQNGSATKNLRDYLVQPGHCTKVKSQQITCSLLLWLMLIIAGATYWMLIMCQVLCQAFYNYFLFDFIITIKREYYYFYFEDKRLTGQTGNLTCPKAHSLEW